MYICQMHMQIDQTRHDIAAVQIDDLIAIQIHALCQQYGVPLFINEGDHIRIDTRTGEYMERV